MISIWMFISYSFDDHSICDISNWWWLLLFVQIINGLTLWLFLFFFFFLSSSHNIYKLYCTEQTRPILTNNNSFKLLTDIFLKKVINLNQFYLKTKSKKNIHFVFQQLSSIFFSNVGVLYSGLNAHWKKIENFLNWPVSECFSFSNQWIQSYLHFF